MITFAFVVLLAVIAAMVRDIGLGGEIAGAGPALWMQLGAGFVSSAGAIAGAIALWRSRRTGLLILEISVLVDLFLVQPFSLLQSQFAALAGVFIDLALLAIIRELAQRERDQREEHQLATQEAPGQPTS
jgi:hypothetical protein